MPPEICRKKCDDREVVVASQQTSELGQTIADRYLVEGLVGRGGMATVYKVRDTRTGMAVALKRGLSGDTPKAARGRLLLQREYHTLEQLRHPRIIEVYDYGVDASGPYYTMELLGGADLDSGGRLPWREACAVLRDVASSLAILHSRGLLHRDVSPRNVRRTADGRAKLIDFGAMTSHGVSVDVVGTPPFVAPEVLQLQPLDSRVDLFSLGALAYFLLSGRHAYPARSIAELRDMWRSQLVRPARFVADIPSALDALVIEMLALDRNARPEHAAEVMSRLCAIASLPSDEHDAVSHAYLRLPSLVGRDAALIAIRKRMLALARGEGGTLCVDGVPGSGRSRMLDATAIEAKLAGAVVVRADARDAAIGHFGVARALYHQLCRLLPQPAAEAIRLSTTLGGFLPEELPEQGRTTLPPSARDEAVMVRELRDFILTLCGSQRMVIAVDDADRIDERSAALLASLGHRAQRNRLLLVFSVDRNERALRSPALRMLYAGAVQVEIEELSAEHAELLMRSVFGDVPHLGLVATHIHGLSHGNPRAAMTLAQHLVDSNLARYEAGRWSLPTYIAERDLPPTLSASLSLRLSTLSQDARELCDALALADGDGATIPDYVMLTSHGDETRTFAALDELIAERVFSADGERYCFSQRAYVAVLCDEMPAERGRPIHSRLADWLASKGGGEIGGRAHHLFEAGRELEAIELLRTLEPRTTLPLPLLERAVEQALRHGLDTRTVLRLRTAIVTKASYVLARDSFWRHAPALLTQVENDCGLARYRELTHVAESVRLLQALQETQQRYERTEPTARGYAVSEAFQELARVVNAFCAMGMGGLDVGPIERLSELEPLFALSPGLDLIRKRIEIARAWVHGDTERCIQLQEQILERISQSDRCGLDEVKLAELVFGLNYGLGAIEAARGSMKAEKRAQLLESLPQTRGIAWMLRHVLALNQGDVTEARRCLRRADLHRLQLGLQGPPATLGAGIQLLAHARLGNLLGVKSAVDDLAVVAREHRGWQPVLLLGRSHQRRLQGDLEGALVQVEEALALVQSRGSLYFTPIAGAHLSLLNALGRDDEALNRARYYLERCDPQERGGSDTELSAAAAIALSRGGERDRAVRLLDNAIAHGCQIGRKGITLGLLYYARARLAIAMSERADFERFADLCADEFKRTKNPSMTAKLERLLQEAVRLELASELRSPHVQELLDMASVQSAYVTLQSRLDECFDTGDRARCALTLLLEHVRGFSGYLYGVYDGGVKLIAALPDDSADAGIDAWVHGHVLAECGPEVQADAASSQAPARRYTDQQGRIFEPVLLFGTRDGTELLAAVFVHQDAPDTQVSDRAFLHTLAEALLVHGDVSGVKVESVVTA